MAKILKAFCLACALVVLAPALADYADVQASLAGVSGQTVTVSVHNPTAAPVSARVRVPVLVDDNMYFLLTSGNFTLAPGATSSISMSAPEPVAEIIDDPEPIGAL